MLKLRTKLRTKPVQPLGEAMAMGDDDTKCTTSQMAESHIPLIEKRNGLRDKQKVDYIGERMDSEYSY
jgi:hypothetical protein